MQFSLMKTAVAALAVCSNVVLGQTAGPFVVENLENLTALSNTLREDAKGITAINFIAGQGSKVINDLRTIIATGSKALPELSQTPGPLAEENAVADAYKDFVTVHQSAMNVLIGKSGILQQFLGAPIAAALRTEERLIDSISFTIIGLVPKHKAEMEKLADSLSESIQKCEKAYSGIDLRNLKRGRAALRESLRM